MIMYEGGGGEGGEGGRAMRTLQHISPRPGATTAETPAALTGSHLPFAMVLLQRAISHWLAHTLGPKVLTQ